MLKNGASRSLLLGLVYQTAVTGRPRSWASFPSKASGLEDKSRPTEGLSAEVVIRGGFFFSQMSLEYLLGISPVIITVTWKYTTEECKVQHWKRYFPWFDICWANFASETLFFFLRLWKGIAFPISKLLYDFHWIGHIRIYVTLRHFRLTILPWKRNRYHIFW
jgi:hypothetical protein